jgi:hypothetical protein
MEFLSSYVMQLPKPALWYHLLDSYSSSDDASVCDLKQFLYSIPGCECAFYI